MGHASIALSKIEVRSKAKILARLCRKPASSVNTALKEVSVQCFVFQQAIFVLNSSAYTAK
jgi:hypothetical protein